MSVANKLVNQRWAQMLAIACAALIGIGIGFGLSMDRDMGQGSDSASRDMSGNEEAMSMKTAEQDVLYWYDPMYPQQRFDKPGPSPFMDMDLVPRYASSGDTGGGEEGDAVGVRVDSNIRQSLGMRTGLVQTKSRTSQLDVTGQVMFNERSITRLQHPRAAYVESVWPLAPGDQVKQGQPLVRLRTPEWTAAQYELLALIETGSDALIDAGKERARSLGMPASLIENVVNEKAVQADWIVRASVAGVVRSLDVRAGMTLSAGAPLLQINRLDSVWVLVSVPQSQAQQVAQGDVAEVYIDGVSSSQHGAVAEILPLLDGGSRHVSLRIELDNRHGDLRPGLSARVQLRDGSEQDDTLVVPTEALIRTGTRTLVMLSSEEGLFQPVEVQTGAELGDVTVIEAGLEEGDAVVTSGQFLLDSEASLQGIAVRPLAEKMANPHGAHEHSVDGGQP